MSTAFVPAAAECARCRATLEIGDLRCGVCGLACPAAPEPCPRPVVQVLRCTQCGAAVSYSAEAQAPQCKFCGSVTKLEQPIDPPEQAEWILPFTVKPAKARRALRRWMSSRGFFQPSDLASAATVESLHPIWWAAWMVNADAFVSWTADSDAGSRRSDWAPHAGQTALPFRNLLVSASRGLTLAEASRLAPSFRLRRARRIDAQPTTALGPRHAILEQFDTQRSAARRAIVEAISATAEAALQKRSIPGSRYRNVHVAVLLQQLKTRRLALPSYVLAYRYRRSLYRAIVHGQDVRCVFGRAPLSVGKVLLVIGLVLLLVVGVIALWAAW